MEQVVKKEKKERKNKVIAALFAALLVIGGGAFVLLTGYVSGGFVNVNIVAVSQHGVAALSIAGPVNALTTTIDVGNTTDQMTTLFVTLIAIMIPLIIIMAYLGIFQDFIGGIGRAFGGLFHKRE